MAERDWPGGKVLVIEDEIKMVRLVSRALSAAGYDVTTATTGLQGMELSRGGGFALIVLDLRLPDIDGFAILASTRDVVPRQPVMVLSALSDARCKVLCFEQGACDYVAKPFALAELVARVRLRTRDRARPLTDRYVSRGDYRLDLQRRIVDVDGATVSLTTREFVLLEYLMGREGEACTREELLEGVWGYGFDPGTNVVDVYVARLRNKLGTTCLTTVRNVGYCFVGS